MVPGIADRSFNYGDGIFTTMRVSAGQLQLWPLHLKRLQLSATKLGFASVDWALLQQQVFAAVTAPEQVVKLVLSRGEGGRGYSPAGITTPNWYISSAVLPDYSLAKQRGIYLECAALRLGIQPLLAGLKHNNRLEQVLLKLEQAEIGCDDLLVLDQQGFVTEAIAANVFFYRAGQWYTPKLINAGVAGVMREHLLSQFACNLVQWQQHELEQVEAMFVCNALMGIVPVRQLAQRALQLAPVQQLSRQLAC
ncbi:MAG: aminodeoxychorismate lyase [Gammaproteobacteria bacterium]|nr:aminodeoxychorismate lyase [Gammaproteobacteria bacterium]MBU1554718.1 aminodeoxychorismate lyase [Gammaproteobacteria bacterium]MBU2070137.1 aminodeoxychorismate lyase [Gammaproteobacteria bacterium]MBU2181888.1 aminodeoxychorismate lyase [Gammaproteobacteria bacterium]MBU2205418.1 aminodeoxychorismate lyase [Gammaproteobacteria bacterium]